MGSTSCPTSPDQRRKYHEVFKAEVLPLAARAVVPLPLRGTQTALPLAGGLLETVLVDQVPLFLAECLRFGLSASMLLLYTYKRLKETKVTLLVILSKNSQKALYVLFPMLIKRCARYGG